MKESSKKYYNQPIELVVIGGSSGSITVLIEILKNLKKDIHFPILIIIHRLKTGRSKLIEVFQKVTSLKVEECNEKITMKDGHVYIAPEDYHVLIESNKTISLDISEPVNFSRPSIDVSFQSAAHVFNNQLAGFLLTGANKDGAEGLYKIYRNNGFCAIQNLNEAEIDTMPKAAKKIFDVLELTAMEISEYINNFIPIHGKHNS